MISPKLAESLGKAFPQHQYSIDPVELITYEIDASFERGIPDGVFFPETTEDVSRMVLWAKESGVALIARGGGTGLAGGAVAESGGFVLSFSRMNSIASVDLIGRSVNVQAGAVNLDVDTAVRKHDLYFPPDPSSQRTSTIGGNMGTNAGGPHCLKYGVTTNYVTGIRAVLADGKVVRFGGRALDYPEYDFCALLVGSEGTLALMTEAELRLVPNPGGVKTMMAAFESLEEAGQAVSAVIASGLLPATMEMMDQAAMRMITEFAPAGLPVDAAAALIVEIDGHPGGVDSQMEEVADLLDANGGFELKIAQTAEERARIWYGRKSAAGALSRLSPQYYLTDVTVPRSQLSDMLHEVIEICEAKNLRMMNVFHAGDGNLHPLILCDKNDADLMDRVHKAGEEIIQRCVERDGSITGEHGVGIEKRSYMKTMFGPNELHAMAQIQDVFDPKAQLNAGKVIPQDVDSPTYEPAIMPTSQTLAPTSGAAVASALRALSEASIPVRISGASSVPQASSSISDEIEQKDDQGRLYTLSTSKLNQLLDFAPDDLYVTVGTGMRIGDLNGQLATHNLRTALAAPHLNATVGGVLAANINSPQRSRYDSLRNNLLCATVALADGRVIHAGRPLVKNVAGYDLPKIFVGSYGSLGVMIDATLKLHPAPRAAKSIRIECPSLEGALHFAHQLLPRTLNSAGLTISNQGSSSLPYRLVFTVEGMDEEVAAEIEMMERVAKEADLGEIKHLAFGSAVSEWAAFMGDVTEQSLIVRVGVPASELPCYLEITSIENDISSVENGLLLMDAAAGFLYIKREIESIAEARLLLDRLRRPFSNIQSVSEGYALVMQTPQILTGENLAWRGYHPECMDLMMELKQRFDPNGILASHF